MKRKEWTQKEENVIENLVLLDECYQMGVNNLKAKLNRSQRAIEQKKHVIRQGLIDKGII